MTHANEKSLFIGLQLPRNSLTESPRTSANVFTATVSKQETLNVYRNMLRATRSKCDKMSKDKAIEEEEVKVGDNNATVMGRKDQEHKPHLKLSARREKFRIREMKNLAMKIANPHSSDKDKHANQHAYALEDATEETHKIKGSKVRSINYTNADTDDCRTLITAEGIVLDKDLCQFLEMELLNANAIILICYF